jgi:hypothetical protein
LVVVAVMMPAAAQTATTGSTPRTPADSAVNSRRGVSQARRSRKDRATASRVAYTTARVALCPSASNTTMRTSDEKWYPNRPSSRHTLVCGISTARTPWRRTSISTASRMPR